MGISYRDMVTPQHFQCPCAKFLRYSADHRLAYLDISHVPWSRTDPRPYDLASVHTIRQDLSRISEDWSKKISDVEIIICPIRYDSRWPQLYPTYCKISIAGSGLYLAGRSEAGLSFDSDRASKIMAFDWRKMLITMFARDSKASWERTLKDLLYTQPTRHSFDYAVNGA
jgi:hypothetical protein